MRISKLAATLNPREENTAAVEGRYSGKSTATALGVVAKSMLDPLVPHQVFQYTEEETKVLLPQVMHILSTLGLKFFNVEVHQRGFIITYQPWIEDLLTDEEKANARL